MIRFLVRRLVFSVVLVAAVSSGALLLTRLAPGDVTAQLGATAAREDIARERARFDLDRGILEQWGLWATRALRFDFGQSFLYNRPVGTLVRQAAANTALLAIVGFNELTQETRMAASSTKAYFTFFLVAGALYLLLTLFSNVIIARVEKWARRGMPATGTQ